jgi:two-component system, OmpR family, sensor kinase
VPEPFAAFAKRLTTSYVLLAVALIVLVVATTSVLAFILYVGSLNETIAANGQRATQRVQTFESQRKTVTEYAPQLAAEIGGARVDMRIYDDSHRLLAASGRRRTTPGRFTLATAALFGLRPSIVRVAGGTIVIAPDLTGFTRLLARYLAFVIPIGALAVLAAWLFGRGITRRAVAPLRDVALALRRIAAGDFAPEPLPTGETSLRELTAAYNEVAHRLTTATAERERNELQMRQFVADAGHELRTPLTIVMGYLEILQQGVVGDPDGVATAYETMLGESRRMRDTIDKLIVLARLERPAASQAAPVDLSAIVKRAAVALEPLAGAGRISVAAPTLPTIVQADGGELYEAIKNVVENAIRYAPASPVRVEIAFDDTSASVVVTDRGPGMSAQDLEHAFDRFYRGGSRSGEGTGLGLAIAKRAVERIGGTIDIASRPDAGTTVTISLPRGSERL